MPPSTAPLIAGEEDAETWRNLAPSNHEPHNPAHNVGVEHEGPEKPGADPCTAQIYFRGVERRTNLKPEDVNRLFVRLTVENWTSTWRLTPDRPGRAFLGAVKEFDPHRAFKAADGSPHVRLKSLQLGSREVAEIELPLALNQPLDGGDFGTTLLEAFGATVDLERGVIAISDCEPKR